MRRWEYNIEIDLQELGWGCGVKTGNHLTEDSSRWRSAMNMAVKLRFR